MQAQIPAGAYGMPELCKLLTKTGGPVCAVDGKLADYPVFVSVKSGDPVRIRELVAAALHAEWKDVDGRLELRPVRPQRDEDFAEFQRLYLTATKARSYFAGLPPKDLYRLPVGRIIRYGQNPNEYVLPLPATIKPSKEIGITRFMFGMFQTGPGDAELDFSGLPADVSALLADDLAKQTQTPEEKGSFQKRVRDPDSLGIDWSEIETHDPMAHVHNLQLTNVGRVASKDIAIALPDMSVIAVVMSGEGDTTVGAILSRYSAADVWKVVDGAAVACLPCCDLEDCAQVKRSVVRKLLAALGKQGVVGTDALSEYISDQRPAASESWADAMMVAMAGLVVDQEYVGDYPFNIRLYLAFDKTDWNRLRSGRPFPASALSAKAQAELLDLLIEARTRLGGTSDPARWQTLDFNKLSLTAKVDEEPVLISFRGPESDVRPARDAGLQYAIAVRGLGHEPLYQPATRRKLTLTIASPNPEESVKTGFSETMPADSKPVVWTDLPKQMAAEFKRGMDARGRGLGAIGGPGKAPPPRP